MRTARLLIAALLLAGLARGAAAGPPSFELNAGESAFWSGPFVESSSGSSCGSARCFTYRLDVTEPGYRLRIGIDRPEIGDVFVAEITEPDGTRAGSISPREDLYSAEFLGSDPAVGTWTVVVRAQEVTDSAFRLRAKLEDEPPSLGVDGKKDPVLPNLQILPPHNASFMFPVTNGTAAELSIGVDIAGREACHAEEHAEDRAVRCIRFSYGVRNTGLGPMDLFVGDGNQLQRELFQRIYRADGTFFERRAGVALWHKTHVHYHHDKAVGLQLFKVVDRKKGTLEEASAPRTKGFAHRDELLRDWEHFYPTPKMQGFGLLPGWADIYEWDRPGNYIDFGLNGDGYYVLRMQADPVKGVRESNERDNFGYTYFRVTNSLAASQIALLEAGRGRDPWDECKIEVGFGGHPDPPREPRPKSCPPDTT